MRRFWVPLEKISATEVLFDEKTWHHIHEVCRFQEKDNFEVVSEGDTIYTVELVSAKKKNGTGKILNTRTLPSLPYPHIHLCLSLPQLKTVENILEKIVELGVKSCHIFLSEYSFFTNLNKISSKKIQRWQTIIQSAMRQTGRGEALHLELHKGFDEILEKYKLSESAQGFFFYEGVSEKPFEEAIKELPKETKNLWLFVGSEGGFSEKEVKHLEKENLPSLTLGSQVLRVETACIAAISALKYSLKS